MRTPGHHLVYPPHTSAYYSSVWTPSGWYRILLASASLLRLGRIRTGQVALLLAATRSGLWDVVVDSPLPLIP